MNRTSLPRPEIGRVRIRYKGSERFAEAFLAYTYRRDDPEVDRGYISGSSGPKDYTHNLLVSCFDGRSTVDAVAVLVYCNTPFAVYRRGGIFSDCSGRELDVERVDD